MFRDLPYFVARADIVQLQGSLCRLECYDGEMAITWLPTVTQFEPFEYHEKYLVASFANWGRNPGAKTLQSRIATIVEMLLRYYPCAH